MPAYHVGHQLPSPRTRDPLLHSNESIDPYSAIQVPLKGLNSGYESLMALYKPTSQLRTMYARAATGLSLEDLCLSPPVEVINSTIMWTCLSIETAKVLYEMDCVITSCLRNLLAERLEYLDTTAFKQQEYLPGKRKNIHILQFCLSDLMGSVLERLQVDCYGELSARPSDNILELLLLYLVSRNSIDESHTHSQMNATISVRLEPSEDFNADTGATSVAYVIQHPDSLTFSNLNSMPREGSFVEIVPQFSRGVFATTNDCYSDVSYSIHQLPSWLQWDDRIFGWKGQVPMYTELRDQSKYSDEVINGGRQGPYAVVNLLRLEVKASLIDRHSSLPVCLKHIIRTRLTLKVIPWYAHQNAHQYADSQDSFTDHSQSLDKACRESCRLYTTAGGSDIMFGCGKRYSSDLDLQSMKNPEFSSFADPAVQVYHVSRASTNWRPCDAQTRRNWNPHLELLTPLAAHLTPQDERSTRQASDSYISRECTSSEIDVSSDELARSSIAPYALQGGSVRRNRSDVSSSAGDMFPIILDRDYRKVSSPHKKQCTTERPHDLGDDLHWQDDEEFGSDFFDQHYQPERHNSLHSDPETIGTDHVLYLVGSQAAPNPFSRLIWDQHLTSVEAVDSSDRALVGHVQHARIEPSVHGEAMNKADAVLLQTVAEVTQIQRKESEMTPPKESPVTYFVNRFAPLGDLNEDSSRIDSRESSQSQQDQSIVIDTLVSSIPLVEENTQSAATDSEHTAKPNHERNIDSGCYMADDESEADDDIVRCDSVVQADLDGNTEQFELPRSPRDTPSIDPEYRPSPLLHSLPSPAISIEHWLPGPSTRNCSRSGLRHTTPDDDIGIDPTLHREQAVLWSILTQNDDDKNTEGKDPKLEAEEKKGLWEVLKWEARQKENENDDEIFGVQSDDGHTTSGESDEVGMGSADWDEDMETAWNFGY